MAAAAVVDGWLASAEAAAACSVWACAKMRGEGVAGGGVETGRGLEKEGPDSLEVA